MALTAERVFAYLKAVLPPGGAADHHVDLLIKPFIGGLAVTLAHDDGDHFTLLQRHHLAELALTEDEAFALGVRNLQCVVDRGVVRLHECGSGYAVIAGGNFEASLLLVDPIWPWVCTHLDTTEILAAAPARDLLMVAPASREGLAELDALIARVASPELPDHPLPFDVYRGDGSAWTLADGPMLKGLRTR